MGHANVNETLQKKIFLINKNATRILRSGLHIIFVVYNP